MSMRTAIMEMYGPKSLERAAWVPESIADEQVEAFMEATVAAIAEGEDTFVFEGKHYKAKSKKEDKLDPVGKEDDDVDNDGDVDSSDKYLKKRRSAIAKRRAMDEEKNESVEEAMSGTYMTVEYDYSDDYGMLELYKNGKKVGSWSGYLDSHSSGNPLAIEATKLAKKHGVNPNGLKTVDGENPKRTGKLSPNKHFGFPVQKAKRESVEESAGTAQHGPDDATSDTFQKQMGGGRSPREKEFVDMHKTETALDIEKVTAQNKQSMEDALKQTPPRMGDQKTGDTSFVNPVKAEIIDGITKALQQMKTNS